MGISHSNLASKSVTAKPKSFSLDAFVADMVKQMVELTVDGVIGEERRKEVGYKYLFKYVVCFKLLTTQFKSKSKIQLPIIQ